MNRLDEDRGSFSNSAVQPRRRRMKDKIAGQLMLSWLERELLNEGFGWIIDDLRAALVDGDSDRVLSAVVTVPNRYRGFLAVCA